MLTEDERRDAEIDLQRAWTDDGPPREFTPVPKDCARSRFWTRMNAAYDLANDVEKIAIKLECERVARLEFAAVRAGLKLWEIGNDQQSYTQEQYTTDRTRSVAPLQAAAPIQTAATDARDPRLAQRLAARYRVQGII